MRIFEAIGSVFEVLGLEEKGYIKIVLEEGEKSADHFSLSGGRVRFDAKRAGAMISAEVVAEKLTKLFATMISETEAPPNIEENYGYHLDFLSEKYANVKELALPSFQSSANDADGILAREKWFVKTILGVLWDKSPNILKEVFADELTAEIHDLPISRQEIRDIIEAVRKKGLYAPLDGVCSNHGLYLSLISRIFLNIISNKHLKRTNATTLSQLSSSLSVLIPTHIGWVLPAGYDKYIPVVFIIGLKRLESFLGD